MVRCLYLWEVQALQRSFSIIENLPQRCPKLHLSHSSSISSVSSTSGATHGILSNTTGFTEMCILLYYT